MSINLALALSFPSTVSQSSMIPVGSDQSPCLVVGQDVAYDRIRVGYEYMIDRSGTMYLELTYCPCT